eukprot:356484-Chlamydomonas_euryale.AAC.5
MQLMVVAPTPSPPDMRLLAPYIAGEMFAFSPAHLSLSIMQLKNAVPTLSLPPGKGLSPLPPHQTEERGADAFSPSKQGPFPPSPHTEVTPPRSLVGGHVAEERGADALSHHHVGHGADPKVVALTHDEVLFGDADALQPLQKRVCKH